MSESQREKKGASGSHDDHADAGSHGRTLPPGTYHVQASNLNVRSEPHVEPSNVIDTLHAGALVEVLAGQPQNGFYLARVGSHAHAWVSGRYLSTGGASGQAAVSRMLAADQGHLAPAPTVAASPETGGGIWSWVVGHTKSMALSIIDRLPIKAASPYSTTFLKHYVEGSGAPFVLSEIPKDWQDWIVTATRGLVGAHPGLSPYNSGIYDLRNSLGHFNAHVSLNPDGSKKFAIDDVYQFGFRETDTAERGRHGFSLGDMSERQLHWLLAALPTEEFDNPGGFKEKFEVKVQGKETVLFIPQDYLAKQGKPFAVSGEFSRASGPTPITRSA